LILAILLIFAFTVNIFFGYWRANVKPLSLQWFLAIHISIPFLVGLRVWLMEWNWVTVPAFVAVFFLGQYAGGRLRKYLLKKPDLSLSSCLVMDLVRMARGSSRG
jgi:hypothetical protein